ncbi:MAG: ferrous iron transport protein A [Planctomycetaceae bacterium]
MNLSQLERGQEAVVAGVDGTGAVMMRLMEIGLVPGRVVSVLRRAALGGPVELLVDRTRIAVRPTEAACVQLVSSDSAATKAPESIASQLPAIA